MFFIVIGISCQCNDRVLLLLLLLTLLGPRFQTVVRRTQLPLHCRLLQFCSVFIVAVLQG